MRILTFAALLLTTTAAYAQTTITDDHIKDMITKAKAYHMVIFKKGPNHDKFDKATHEKDQMEHLRHMAAQKEDGILPLFGPFMDDGDVRGILIYDIPSREDVKAWVEKDPHIKSGYLAYEIRPWFGLPGSKLP